MRPGSGYGRRSDYPRAEWRRNYAGCGCIRQLSRNRDEGGTMSTATQDSAKTGAWSRKVFAALAKWGTMIGLAIMLGAFSLLAPVAFPTVNNFLNILNQASLTMIIAGGLTVAVIIGELDLSIGFAASYAGVLVTGLIVNQGWPVFAAIPAGLWCGALIGVVHGLIGTKVRVNSVIAPLGIGNIIH